MRRPKHKRLLILITKVPIVIPWVMVFLSIYLVLTPIIANPRLEFVYSLAFIVSGLVVYIPFVRYGLVLPGTGTLTLGQFWLRII